MPPALILTLLLFPLVTFGLAWPLASRLALEPAEKLCAALILSLLGTYAVAFGTYLLNLPHGVFWVLPLLAAAGYVCAARFRAMSDTVRDVDVRSLLVGQLLVAGWCVGWLSLVTSYSGDGWSGDWIEHWRRTGFFLNHSPHDTKFLAYYTLPARPPLANLITGAMLGLTGVTFPGYQLVMTLLN